MAQIDVTEKIGIGWVDDGVLKIEQCVCGARPDYFVISADDYKDANTCEECGRRFQLVQITKVYEVTP
jgi:hypothetical protein